jgi:YD repeat-containing protein
MYRYNRYKIGTGSEVLTSKKEYICKDETCSVFDWEGVKQEKNYISEVQYEYDSETLLPISETILNSNGVEYKTTYVYPMDSSSVIPYNEMVEHNIISPVIEKNYYVNNNHVRREKTPYAKWRNSFFAPSHTTQQKMGLGSEESVLWYEDYDIYGNLLQTSKQNGLRVVYLWGYSNTYPIAEIANANYTQVRNELGADVIARLANSGTPSVEDLKKLNGLRGKLSSAQITTYTYKPLVGVESVIDLRGVEVKYVYDTYGRLSKILDYEGNIVQGQEYNYINK